MRLAENVLSIENDVLAGSQPMRDGDLRPHDERKDHDVRDARSDPRPQTIESKERCRSHGDPSVKADRGRATAKHTDPDSPPDLAGRRVLFLREIPDLP